jgi:hypothetical protein
VEDQLKLSLGQKCIHEQLEKSSFPCHTLECDIGEGSEYKKRNIIFPQSISLTCNTDGVPVFSSLNASMWPVYFIVNELPLPLRNLLMLMGAL